MTNRQPLTELGRNSQLWQPPRGLNKLVERIAVTVFGLFALVSVLTTFGIVFVLLGETVNFFGEVSLWRFLTDTRWTPLFTDKQYGIMVLLSATFMTAAIALLVAVPIGIMGAIYLSEYANAKVRQWVKPMLEILAGVPTVVFGYFALLFVTPLLQDLLAPLGIELDGFNSISAGVVMGFAIVPLVASLSEDALYAVPQRLRQGAYALGATKREVVTGVVLPGALSGIVASMVLAMSRAVGETMIVTVAAGQSPTLTLDPTVAVQTMTSFIVQVSLGDAPAGTLAYKTLFAVGTTLFLITLALNLVSFWFVRAFREEYE